MKDNQVTPAHSPTGASNCERWYNCPGSVDLISKAPPEKPSRYAAEGTAAHLAAAERLNRSIIETRLGATVLVDGFKIEITEDMLDAVDEYTDYVFGLIAKYRLLSAYYWVERKVEIPVPETEYGDNALFGTADFVALVPYDRLIVIDYKHGAGVRVRVRDNKQLLYYALGAWLALPPSLADEIATVQIVIAQPRCPGGGIDSIELPVSELAAFRAELIEAVQRVKPGAPLKAGDHCKWCPAKPICPAIKNQMLMDLGVDFSDVNVSVVINSGLPNPATLPLDEIRRILFITDLAKSYLDSVWDVAYGYLEANPELSKELGHKLVKKRSNRAYIDKDAALHELYGDHGETVLKRSLQSPAQLEKLLGKTEAEKYAHLWHNPDNGYTMVRNDDDRQTKSITAEADFTDVI